MATIKLYSYLTEDHKRVYSGTSLVVNKSKHGDIIANDQNELVVLVKHGISPRLKSYPATRYDIDKITTAILEDKNNG